MIIDTSQGKIETYGDIKEFKTSIDPKNLEFITTLLSSNLYSDPEQSFIREIVSNAWDSHVEAGTTDTPVIIKITEQSHNNSITIRDYGTGLSPERFNQIYRNIGSSTKRESNEYIGGFGIGKYSALACSNTVYITSYYKGIAYYYVMVKSGNAITINLLMESPTVEKNGVEITIKGIKEIMPYIRALDYIVFFPNIYIDLKDTDLNSIKLKRFTNFAATTIHCKSKLLLGNVLYPCNSNLLDIKSTEFLNNIRNTGIVIKFDVGEIDITPNRENIIYTSETIKKIEDRIKAAKEELEGMIKAKVEKDYDDIEEYLRILKERVFYNPISDSCDNYYGGYGVYLHDIPNISITYKGNDLSSSLSTISKLLVTLLPKLKGITGSCKFYKTKFPYSSEQGKIRSKRIVMLKEDIRITAPVRTYLVECWDDYAIVGSFTFDEFKEYIDDIFSASHYILPKEPQTDIIIKGIYDLIISTAKHVDVTSDSRYLEIKQELSTKNEKASFNKEAILYIYSSLSNYRVKHSFDNLTKALNFLKGLHTGVILVNMDMDDSMLWEVAALRGFKLVKARKDIVSEIRALNLSYILDPDWVLRKDPVLRKVAAIRKVFSSMIISKECTQYVPADLKKEFEKIYKDYIKYIVGNSYYSNLALENGKRDNYDPYTLHICELFKSYINKHKKIEELVEPIGKDYEELVAAAIIKTKAYRVNPEMYNKVKNNKLLKVLCRK